MKFCSTSSFLLPRLMYFMLLPVLEAQKVQVDPEVTGYVGHDVTLPCHFIPGLENANITQVQWELKPPEGMKINIIVSSPVFGVRIQESFLKDRVEMAEQSLIIRDVEMRDAGLYTCTITTFPSGRFDATTNLVVQEQMPLSSGVVSVIVIAVLLLLVITAAVTYLIFIRRPESSFRRCVYINRRGPLMDVATTREEDVVYSDVKLKASRDETPSTNNKHTNNVYDDDVTYSEVIVSRGQIK